MPRTTRRSARIQEIHKNDEHLAEALSPKKQKLNQSDDETCFQNDALKEALSNIELPTELINDSDFDCSEMYKVTQQRFSSTAMMNKALSCQQSLIENSPRVLLKNLKLNEKTKQHHNKNNTKRQIDENSQINSTPSLRSGRIRTATSDYNMKPEEYFIFQSEKSLTSNNTLSKLKKKRFEKAHVKTSNIPNSHEKFIQNRMKELETYYTEWLDLMKEGFTVLLYGLGSKRLLIKNFEKQMLSDEPVLTINGFFPSLTIKEILDGIITDLLGLETVTNLNECFEIIENTLKSNPDDSIYLLIHNIDGGMLRSKKAQDVLSRLANIQNLHVLASVDHINAPLIWDNVTRTRYNFYWMDVTTFEPYEAETSYESSFLAQKSGNLALLSLQNVFASLTKNAKEIYILLVKYQLTNNKRDYMGMAFKDLYRESREGFLVSSDQALRSQLTEFIDHKLVKTKRNASGIESLMIPLDNASLKQFLEQQNESL